MLNLNHTNRDQVNFDLKETAQLMNLTPAQVRQLIKRQELDGFKCGSLWWITRDSIEKYISEQA